MQYNIDEIIDLCEQISNCDNIKQIKKLVTKICVLLGWEYWIYTTKIPLKFSKNNSLLLTNLPYSWLAYYYYHKLIKIDPIYNYPAISILPIVWNTAHDEIFDSSLDTKKFKNALAKYGWTGGVAIPVQSQLTRGLINFTTKMPFKSKEKNIPVTNLIGPAIALAIQDRMFKLEVEPKFGIHGRLSGREMEVLRYAADGYAAKIIADKLGIAERTVVEYLQTSAKKLGTAAKDDNWKVEGKNRQELIIKAFTFGYLNQNNDWTDETMVNTGFYENHEFDEWDHSLDFIKDLIRDNETDK